MFWKQQGNKTENTSSLEGCAIPDGKFYKLFDAFKKLLLVAKRFFSKLTKFTVTESKTIYLVMRLCLPRGLLRPKNAKYSLKSPYVY